MECTDLWLWDLDPRNKIKEVAGSNGDVDFGETHKDKLDPS